MRAISKKRASERAAREAVLVEVVQRDGYTCSAEGIAPGACGSPWPHRKPLEGNEVIRRSAWPGGHLVASNVRLLCQTHHDWVTAHPREAIELGLQANSWDRPKEEA